MKTKMRMIMKTKTKSLNFKRAVCSICAAAIGTASCAAAVWADTNSDTTQTLGGVSVVAEAVQYGEYETLPLRDVAEGLGYTVDWNDETRQITCTRGAYSAGLTIGRDGYTVSKTAAIPLGCAPYLYNDEITYVPVEFFTEILDAYVFNTDDEFITISEPEIVTFVSYTVDEYGAYITVNSPTLGEVEVRITDETVTDTDFDPEALTEGRELEVCYGAAMTMSLPPQTNGLMIKKVDTNSPNEDTI